MTKDDLKKRLQKEHGDIIIALTQHFDITGRSKMNKKERIEALINQEEIHILLKVLKKVKAKQRRKFIWKKAYAKIGGIITILLLFIGNFNNVIDFFHEKKNLAFEYFQDNTKPTTPFIPIFNDASKDSLFKILIVPFENRQNKESTECVGKAIYTHLEDQLRTNDSIPIWVEYVDSINTPEKADSAMAIRKRHKADLIIYGLAKNIDSQCQESDVCFRYILTDSLLGNVPDGHPLKIINHGLRYQTLLTDSIEQGKLSFDLQSIVYMFSLMNFVGKKEPKSEIVNRLIHYLSKTINQLEGNNDDINAKLICLFNRAHLYNYLGKTEQSILDFNRAINIDKNNPLVYIWRGYFYFITKKHSLALKDFSKTIELDSNYINAYRLRADIYNNFKKHDLAFKDYDKIIELDGYNTNSYITRGNLYLYLEKYDLALKDYSKAIKLDKNNANTYFNRATCYKNLKEYDLALKDYNKAIRLNQNFVLAYYIRGSIYSEKQRYKLALQDYNKFIEFDSDLVCKTCTYIERACVYSKIKKYNLALGDYDKALEIDSNLYHNTDIYIKKSNVYSKIKKYDLVLEAYDKALELSENCAIIYNSRGYFYAGLKKYNLAVQDYDKAIEADDNYAYPYNNKGKVYYYKKKYKLGLLEINKSISLDGNNAYAYHNRANIYKNLKKPDLALQDFNKAIELAKEQQDTTLLKEIEKDKEELLQTKTAIN